jgi:hypothetical protein
LLAAGVLLAILAIATALRLANSPLIISADLIGSVICALLALLFRSVPGRLDQAA